MSRGQNELSWVDSLHVKLTDVDSWKYKRHISQFFVIKSLIKITSYEVRWSSIWLWIVNFSLSYNKLEQLTHKSLEQLKITNKPATVEAHKRWRIAQTIGKPNGRVWNILQFLALKPRTDVTKKETCSENRSDDAFTLLNTETHTDTDTDEICTEPNGNLHWCLPVSVSIQAIFSVSVLVWVSGSVLAQLFNKTLSRKDTDRT